MLSTGTSEKRKREMANVPSENEADLANSKIKRAINRYDLLVKKGQMWTVDVSQKAQN